MAFPVSNKTTNWSHHRRQKRQRAKRITEPEWNRYQSRLCRLYENNKLVDVMSIIARQGFRPRYSHQPSPLPTPATDTPSKRQLTYRFEKWGLNKYGKKHHNSDAATIDDIDSPGFDDEQDEDDAFTTEQDDSWLNEQDMDDFQYDGVDDLEPDDSFDLDEDEDTILDMVDHPIPTPNPLTNVDYKTKLAADFLSALSDDEAAFSIFAPLCSSSLSVSKPLSTPLSSEMLLVSTIRSVDGPEAARTARQLMVKYQARHSGSFKKFMASMLDAYMQERGTSKDRAGVARRVGRIMSGLFEAEDYLAELQNEYLSIDLLTYRFLSHGLDAYAALRPHDAGDATFDPDDHLNKYVSAQPFIARLRSGSRRPCALRSCVTWCQTQLHRDDITIPLAVQNITAAQNHTPWMDDIQLFCTLWDAMLQCLLQDNNFPAWYANSEAELGISPSELLVTLCWIIGDNDTAPTATQSPVGDVLPILQRAQSSTDILVHWPEPRLWEAFLNKFTEMNKLVDLVPEDQSFEASASSCARAYVSSALDIQLPNQSVPVPASAPQGTNTTSNGAGQDLDNHDFADFLDMNFIDKQSGMNNFTDKQSDMDSFIDPQMLGGDSFVDFGGYMGAHSAMNVLPNQFNEVMDLA